VATAASEARKEATEVASVAEMEVAATEAATEGAQSAGGERAGPAPVVAAAVWARTVVALGATGGKGTAETPAAQAVASVESEEAWWGCSECS
jgi:hypothetical protein